MIYRFALVIALFLTQSAVVFAADSLISVDLVDGLDHCSLRRSIEFLEDKSGNLTINDVTSPAAAIRFFRSDRETPDFGISDSVYWLRFCISDQSTLAAI